VALAKARGLRDVIAQLEVARATKFASLAVALDDANVNLSEGSEDKGNEGSKKEEESAQETGCLAFEAATNTALELRGEADGTGQATQRGWFRIARRAKLPLTKKLSGPRGERSGFGAGM
jgi:hypothetical protein